MGEHNADDMDPSSTSPGRATEPTIRDGPPQPGVVLLPSERRTLGTLLLLFGSVFLVLYVRDLVGVVDWTAVDSRRRLGYALSGAAAAVAGIRLRSLQPRKPLVVAYVLLVLGSVVMLIVSLAREYVP